MRKIFSSLLSLCHEELRQRQKGLQPSTNMVYLKKWPLYVNIKYFMTCLQYTTGYPFTVSDYSAAISA